MIQQMILTKSWLAFKLPTNRLPLSPKPGAQLYFKVLYLESLFFLFSSMDEAAKRVTGVIDELQKTQDDFWVDLPIKAGAGKF